MANPNSEIWGAPETWANAKIQTITTSSFADVLKCSPVKIANFGGSDNRWRGSLARGMSAGKITPQQGIDKTVCPCGQDKAVSAFGKIAIINENSELSATPSRIIERDKNVNWCFCELQADTLSVPNHFLFIKSFTYSNTNNKGLDQFAPDATYGDNNKSEWQVPYLSYQINSLLLSIQVYCITNETASSLSATWRTLDDWKNNYNNQSICGLRVRVRGVNSINTSSPIKIIYDDTDKSQYLYSGMICVLDTIDTPNRNGNIVDTSFYGIYSYSDRGSYGYMFMPTYISKNAYTGVFPAWNMFSGQQLKRHSVTSADATYYYSIPYSDDNYEKILKMVACFGCYFTPSNKYQFTYDMLDTDLYLPIIDENGVTHGEYTHGAANATNPLYAKTSIRDIDYNPDAPPTPVDPNTYSNTTGFNSLTSGASMVERYVLNDSNVRQLLSDLWTITDDLALDAGNVDFSELSEKILDEFLVTNPIDCIVSLKRYPFNIPHTFSSNKAPLKLGKTQVTSQGYPTHNIFNTVLFSGVNIYPKFGGSFLDYAPYTEYELYVPFCGTIKLNAGDVLGHTLNCRLQIDLITGVCTAYILADELVIETMTGNCACEMQITGTDTSYMAGSITGAITQAKSTKLANITTSWSPLSIGGAISTVSNPWKQGQTAISARYEREKAEYDLQHIQSPVHTMGSASPLTSWYQEFNARLIIYYPEGDAIDSSGGVSSTSPKLADLTDYAHTTGFACVMNGQVSDYHGLTVGNIDTSSIVGASEEERNMIKALFSQGVWLP